MLALSVIAGALGYLITAVAIARPIYGRMRARSIDHNIRRYPSLYLPSAYYATDRDPVKRWEEIDEGFVIFGTVLLAAIWPIAWLYPATVAIGPRLWRAFKNWVGGSSIRSHTEQRLALEQQAKRIAELERELNLK